MSKLPANKIEVGYDYIMLDGVELIVQHDSFNIEQCGRDGVNAAALVIFAEAITFTQKKRGELNDDERLALFEDNLKRSNEQTRIAQAIDKGSLT